MHGLFLFSCVVCLTFARPQEGYNYGESFEQFQPLPTAQELQPLQQSSAAQLATAIEQIEMLGQLPSLSDQTLTTGNAASFESAPIQVQFTHEASQSSFPQHQFTPLAFSPSFVDIAPSNLAEQTPSPVVQLAATQAQESQPAQFSGLYQTANFPDPITTTYKHIYGESSQCYF